MTLCTTHTPAPHDPAHGPAVLADALTSTAAPVLLLDRAGSLVAANPAGTRLLRTGSGTDEPLVVLAGARHRHELMAAVAHVLRTGQCQTVQTTTASASSTTHAWSLSPVPGQPGRVSMVGVDITATTSALDDLRARACTDELTGLANRAGLLEAMQERAGSGALLLFCDLNGFKAVNDTHGHAAGDQVLVEVARRFRRAVRGEDLVARLGGDEFVVLAAPSPTASAAGLRKRIVTAVQQPMLLGGGLVVLVGAAVGLASLEPGLDPSVALQRADAAMYEGKPTRASVAAVVRRDSDVQPGQDR